MIRKIILKLPDSELETVTWSENQSINININDSPINTNTFAVAVQTPFKILEITPLSNFYNGLSNDATITISNVSVDFIERYDNTGTICYSLFENSPWSGGDKFHDCGDENDIAIAQPTIEIANDETYIVNDTYKPLPILSVFQDPIHQSTIPKLW